MCVYIYDVGKKVKLFFSRTLYIIYIILYINTWIGITKQFVSRFVRVFTTSLYSITSTIRANLVGGIFQRQHEKWHRW